jgi:hypothetical protein
MTRFATFALLYMTAVLLELVERWRHPYPAVATLALVLLLVGVGITRVTFLAFLAGSTGYLLFVLFPDVANHVNIIIYCNLLLMTGIVWSLLRREAYPGDDDAYEALAPVLRSSMVLVYALAGFAKLNHDFLDPQVSCVGSMVGDLGRLVRSRVAMLPTVLVLLAILLLIAGRLLGPRLRRPARIGGGVALLALGAVTLPLARDLPPSLTLPLVLGMAILVILWELVFGPLLAVPAVQLPVLVFSWSMHATLALIGFVDFGALALTLLLTFMPAAWFDTIRTPLPLRFLGRPVYRVHLYFAVCLLAAAASALGRRFPAGLAFNLAALILLYPVLATALSRTRPAWTGLSLRGPLTPRWLYLFPLALVLHGATSYLGLRTAGNFTMFSNLRTEGAESNHLLLARNPLKLWHYQEDTVRVIRIDDEQAAIGYNYQPLQGNSLPVVEFRKLVYWWARAGRAVPMTFEYGGVTYTTSDIAREPAWRTTGRDWEMRLMDFRVIQGSGPNRCRW